MTTVANSHHFRFVGIEFAPVAGRSLVYLIVTIGNSDTSPATLAHHIVFDRCYVHGDPDANDRRGIEMDGAYVAVVDSYISDFQEEGADTQGLLAYNTTGPLQIRNNYIEAAARERDVRRRGLPRARARAQRTSRSATTTSSSRCPHPDPVHR